MIYNEHVYVNDELFLKICRNKSKNVEFWLRLSKNVKQLNEILFNFELNANVYFSIRVNSLSITTKTFENATNYSYDSKKEKYRFFRIKVLSQKKLCESRWKKSFSKIEEKKRQEKKNFRQLNSFELTIIYRKKNDDDKMMKNVKIKFANKFSLF